MHLTSLLIMMASLLVGWCNCTSSLSVMVNRGQDECFYIPKGSGDTITASFQVCGFFQICGGGGKERYSEKLMHITF